MTLPSSTQRSRSPPSDSHGPPPPKADSVEVLRQLTEEFSKVLGVEDLTRYAIDAYRASCTASLLDELAAVLDGPEDDFMAPGFDILAPGPADRWAATHPWRAEVLAGYKGEPHECESLGSAGAEFARQRRKMEKAIARLEEAFFEADRLLDGARRRVGNYDNAVEGLLRLLDRRVPCARPSEFQTRRYDGARARLAALEEELKKICRRPCEAPIATVRAGEFVKLRWGHGDEPAEAAELRALDARGLRLKGADNGAPAHSADGFDTWEVEEIK